MQGRQLRDSTRRLCNIIDLVQQQKVPALIYSCGAEKAFDTVNWELMLLALQEMGFIQQYLIWLKLIYSYQEAEVWHEEYRSGKFIYVRDAHYYYLTL